MISSLKKNEVYTDLLAAIRSGRFRAGDKFPPEVRLAADFKVGRITLRAALERLEKEGVLERCRGKGTIVKSEQQKSGGTIIILYGYEESIAHPCHYMPQELIRFAKECNCRPLVMERKTFELYSAEDIQRFIQREQVVGIAALLCNFRGDEPILKTLQQLETQVVFLLTMGRDPEITNRPCIGVNQREAVELALSFLAGRQYGDIALLANDVTNFRGWEHSELPGLFRKHGLVFHEEWYEELPFDRERIKAAVRRYCSGRKRPRAILCYSAYSAIYVYETAKELNLSIPEDLAVLGICGYLGTRVLSPVLSTINFHYDRIAERAIRMILDKECESARGKFIGIKPMLVDAESTALERRSPAGRRIPLEKNKRNIGSGIRSVR